MTDRHDGLEQLDSPTTQPPPQPVELDQSPRPRAVTAAASLMVLLTVVVLLLVALAMYAIVSISDAVTTSRADAAALESFKSATIVVAVGFLLIGLGVFGLSLAVLRGHDWGRYTTIGVYIVFALCTVVLALVVVAVSSSFETMSGSIALADIVFDGALLFVLGGQLLGMVATIGLLVLPVSHQWFKACTVARRKPPVLPG